MVVGLTGGICTGKSAAAKIFCELGAVVISADEISRRLMVPGSEITKKVIEQFGPSIKLIDGSVDRAELGKLIFGDDAARRKLEALTHPAIIAEIWREVNSIPLSDPDSQVVVEAPLLFEAGMQDKFDKILVVASNEEMQLKRLMDRDHLERHDAARRIKSQWPMQQKCENADVVIRNDGSLSDLRNEIQRVWEEITCGATNKVA